MKPLHIAIILVILSTVVLPIFIMGKTNDNNSAIGQQPIATPEIFVPFTASFEIHTKGTKRLFIDSMYHNRSDGVFIESKNPAIIQVKKVGVTWQQFFDTLPMSLNAECLVTGTRQQFCTGSGGVLRFFLNGENTPNALEHKIKPDDSLVVKFE